jgi:hypothetical protein
MEIEVKLPDPKPAPPLGPVVVGTLQDGSIIVRGIHCAIVLKGKYQFDGEGWTVPGLPTALTPFPPGTVITITV